MNAKKNIIKTCNVPPTLATFPTSFNFFNLISIPAVKIKKATPIWDKLLINSAKGSCGCTVPSYKKEDGTSEWAPGESGIIKVKYATNRIGKFTKTITLSTNTSDSKPVILTIKGEVLAPKKETGVPTKDTKGSPLEKK